MRPRPHSLTPLPVGGLCRHAEPGGIPSCAVFSRCARYRYLLARIWDETAPLVAFCGLNPSTADETRNDPTVARCQAYARRWGCGGLLMLNLFAFRSARPSDLRAAEKPIGPANNRFLAWCGTVASFTVACWGVHGTYRGRAEEVFPLLKNPHQLGLTFGGQPRHPLYLLSALRPTPMDRRWPLS